jgi:hypothetical protein
MLARIALYHERHAANPSALVMFQTGPYGFGQSHPWTLVLLPVPAA